MARENPSLARLEQAQNVNPGMGKLDSIARVFGFPNFRAMMADAQEPLPDEQPESEDLRTVKETVADLRQRVLRIEHERRGHASQRQDGRWMGQIVVGKKPDGRRDIRTVYGATEAHAEAALDDLRRRLLGGSLGEPAAERRLVRDSLRAWLEDRRGSLVASTWRDYDLALRRLEPLLGHHTLGTLQRRPELVRAAYRDLAGRLSPSSVSKAHTALHQALDQAVQDGVLVRNVAALTRLPKQTPAEQHPLAPDKVRRLLEVARGTRLEALLALALYTGCRQGELLGLLWRDVDLERAALTVRRVLAWTREGPSVRAYPKSHAGLRTIPLPSEAVAALDAHQQRQIAERERLGRVWPPGSPPPLPLVFPSATGTPWQATNLIRRFNTLRDTAGLHPEATFHDLRHTYASGLFAERRPLTRIAALLGHGSAAVTARLYAHWAAGYGDDAADAAAIARFYAADHAADHADNRQHGEAVGGAEGAGGEVVSR